MIDEEGNRLKLRAYSSPAAVACFQYGFTFDEDIADDDTVIERDGVGLVVDPMSFQYLAGSEVDYQEGLKVRGSSSRTRTPPRLAVADSRSRSDVDVLRKRRAYMRGVFVSGGIQRAQSSGTERTGHIRAVAGQALEKPMG